MYAAEIFGNIADQPPQALLVVRAEKKDFPGFTVKRTTLLVHLLAVVTLRGLFQNYMDVCAPIPEAVDRDPANFVAAPILCFSRDLKRPYQHIMIGNEFED